MKIIEEILDEVKKTEVNNITNIIIKYHDLEGEGFFEKMDFLRWVLNILQEEHNLKLMETSVVPFKHWKWKLPFYFDSKYKFIQFDLERMEEEYSADKSSIECGSIWKRSVDNTVIEVQAIEGKSHIFVKVLEGPGLMNDILNPSVLQAFWDKKSQLVAE